jgi:hypothetical protein
MKSCDVGDDVMWHDDNVNTEVIDDLPDKFNKESNTNSHLPLLNVYDNND